MNLDDIKQILELVREHELAEFELERDGLKVQVRKDASLGGAAVVMVPQSGPGSAAGETAGGSRNSGANRGAGSTDGMALAVIKSPIVGTLYRSSNPARLPSLTSARLSKRGRSAVHHRGDEADEEDRAIATGKSRRSTLKTDSLFNMGDRLFAIKVA
jgi:acetyl-CoA carboxylase biotin carboxyl carrier protein